VDKHVDVFIKSFLFNLGSRIILFKRERGKKALACNSFLWGAVWFWGVFSLGGPGGLIYLLKIMDRKHRWKFRAETDFRS